MIDKNRYPTCDPDAICPAVCSLARPCLFLDPRSGAGVYLAASHDTAESAIAVFDSLPKSKDASAANSGRKRIIWDHRELQDKAIAFVNGLDDRALELTKLMASGSAKMDGRIPIQAECSVNLCAVEEEDLLFRLCADTEELFALVPRSRYKFLADCLAKSSLHDDEPYLIDKEWACHAIDVFEEEGIAI